MNLISTIWDTLLHARTVLLTTHVNPDGDAVGSLLGFGSALEAEGLKVTMFLNDSIPRFLRFLPGSNLIVQNLNGVRSFDAGVILDCGSLDRVGKEALQVSRIGTVVNIDHHESNQLFGDLNFVRPESSSTAEIVFQIFRDMDHHINQDEATNLYTGILTDTGSFCYGNINQGALKIAAELVGAGADPLLVASSVYGQYHLGRLHLLQRALSSVELFLEGRLSMITLTLKDMALTNTMPEDVRGFVDFARNIPGVEIGVLLRELNEGGTEVSLRSNGRCNIAQFAAKMGGGGHRNAAGFTSAMNAGMVKLNLVEGLQCLL
jgi:bifunctional oligoribonuclease and PAP phosphatase NrnA